jgi:hypothetical protein
LFTKPKQHVILEKSIIMERKFKNGQQFHQSTKKTTTYDIGIQFLVFERYNKCGGVNGILSLPS